MAGESPATPIREPEIGLVRRAVNAVVGTAIGWIWIIGLDVVAALLTEDEGERPDDGPEDGLRAEAGPAAISATLCGNPEGHKHVLGPSW